MRGGQVRIERERALEGDLRVLPAQIASTKGAECRERLGPERIERNRSLGRLSHALERLAGRTRAGCQMHDCYSHAGIGRHELTVSGHYMLKELDGEVEFRPVPRRGLVRDRKRSQVEVVRFWVRAVASLPADSLQPQIVHDRSRDLILDRKDVT